MSCHWTTNVLLFAVTGKILGSFLLLPSLVAASFRTVIRAVFIEGYLDVGLYECAILCYLAIKGKAENNSSAEDVSLMSLLLTKVFDFVSFSTSPSPCIRSLGLASRTCSAHHAAYSLMLILVHDYFRFSNSVALSVSTFD